MKKITAFLSILCLSFLLSACGNQETGDEQKKEAAKGQSYSVTDDIGQELTFDSVPETIVSTAPSNTEIIFALGSGDKLVGASEFDNYPEEAKKIERMSNAMSINTEAIIGMNPDVVIAYKDGPEGLKQIEGAGIPVFVIDSAITIDDVYGNIEQIAAVLGTEKKGTAVVEGIRQQIAAVQEKTAAVKDTKEVYFEVSPSPDIYTSGAATFQDEILSAAGIGNVFSDQEGWVKISEEEIINRNPAYIMTTVDFTDDPIAEIKNRPSWNSIQAVKEDHVYFLDPDLFSRPGPRIGDAVEAAAKTIYPEVFPE